MRDLLLCAKHLFFAAMPARGSRMSNGSAKRFSLMRGSSGWGLAAVHSGGYSRPLQALGIAEREAE